MTYYCAQIDENNQCFAILGSHTKVTGDKVVSIDSYDTSLLEKRYVDGKWQDPEEEA